MRKTIREILQTVLLALLLFTGLQASIKTYLVEGFSMQPTLEEGQYLLLNKLAYYHVDKEHLSRYVPFLDANNGEVAYLFNSPKIGEVIVFRFPNDLSRNFVKRVIAVPGDAVEIRRGKVYSNDKILKEPYLLEPPGTVIMERKVMGPEEYFVMGDNRLHSNDSRSWGPVPLENIVGRVWISYWPFSNLDAF